MKTALVGAAVAAIVGLAWLVGSGTLSLPGPATAGSEAVSNAVSEPGSDIAAGQALYAESCASCHGANLQGQPDWQSPGEDGVYPAPPHDREGHTWHHADSMLFEYIKIGGQESLARQGVAFNSGMPAFGDQLTDDQINSILAFIKSTWPERERNLQAQRTKAEDQAEGQQEEN